MHILLHFHTSQKTWPQQLPLKLVTPATKITTNVNIIRENVRFWLKKEIITHIVASWYLYMETTRKTEVWWK